MSIIVLNFHGIGEPHSGIPDDERPYWLDIAMFEDLLERIWTHHEPRRYAFTFDDGNASDLLAAEMLAARGATGRFFVLAGRLDDDFYLSRDDIVKLRKDGMIVGLHGHDHLDWRRCDPATFEKEIEFSRRQLEQSLQSRVDEVAIPFGLYNRAVMTGLRKAGFHRIHTSDGGTATAGAKIWNRNTMRKDMTSDQIDSILAGRWSMARNLRRSLAAFAKRNVV